jgi:hypothetical protein
MAEMFQYNQFFERVSPVKRLRQSKHGSLSPEQPLPAKHKILMP